MLCGLAFVNSVHFTKAQTAITPNSIIASNTTWTLGNSPYTTTTTGYNVEVLVESGVTLTIEPEVTVLDVSILVNGTLVAKGTNNNKINFEGSLITFTQYSTSWNTQTNTGSIIEYANIITQNAAMSRAGISISGSSPLISNNNLNCEIGVSGGSPIISSNQFTNFYYTDMYGRPQVAEGEIVLDGGNNVVIADNNISQAGLDIQGSCSLIVERNLINGVTFEDAISNVNAIIENNTLYEGIFVGQYDQQMQLIFMYNNFDYNISNYNTIEWYPTENLNATYNWWGTANQQTINQSIIDFKNNFNSGTVNFVPFLTQPNPQAIPNPSVPIPTPNASPSSTSSPMSSLSPSTLPSGNPTSTPNQSVTHFLSSLNLVEVAILTVLIIIALLLAVIALLLRKKR